MFDPHCRISTIAIAVVMAACSRSSALEDAGVDGGFDAGADGGYDAGIDAGALSDAGSVDAGPDGGLDAGVDAGPSCGDPTSTPAMPCGTLTWAKSVVDSRPRNHHLTWIVSTDAGPFIYAAGGANYDPNTGLAETIAFVDVAPIQPDGSPGAWKPTTSLPRSVAGLTGAPINGAIVVAGGVGPVTSDLSYIAQIQGDGMLGPWTSAGSVLHNRMHAGAFAANGSVYVLGGFENETVFDDVLKLGISPDGTPQGDWTTAGTLPGPRSHFSVSYLNGYVYLTGGLAKSAYDNPPELTDVSRARLAEDGTLVEWTAMPSLTVGLATHSAFFYGGYLYVCGGINGVPAQEKHCWRSPMGYNLSLGPWEVATPLPIARGHVHQLPLWENHVYSIAGAIDFNLTSTTEIDIGTFE